MRSAATGTESRELPSVRVAAPFNNYQLKGSEPSTVVQQLFLFGHSGFGREHCLRDLHHRHRAVLARALQDAIRFLLRRSRTAHEDALRALDHLAVLELLLGRLRVLARRGE